MSPIEAVYLIGSALSVEALFAAAAALLDAGIIATSPAEFATLSEAASALLSADAVVMIDGWESSPGAHVEVTLAAALGKPVLSISDLLPLAA